MIVRVLGAIAAGDDESSLREPPGLVPAAVLAHLALARGHVLTPDALADRVWDERPDNPRNALQAAVSRLRKSFSPTIVESTQAGYRVDVARISVDIVEAERLEQEARAASSAGDPGSAAELAAEALALFRGDPLAGLQSQASDAARVNADELRLRLVGLRAEGLLATGQAGAAVVLMRSTCTGAPLSEPAHGLLMRALVAEGRPNDALTAYDGLRRRLADELGADPSAEVSGIFAAILAGELESPVPSPAAPSVRARQPGKVSAPHDVGLLITDVVGSTRRWAESPELMPELMLAHHAVVADVVAQHGGRLPPDQGEGDSRLAVFPTATAAVQAAGALQQALHALDWPGGIRLSVRMGVHAGSVVEADGNVFGRTVHRTARLRALAHGDQVLVTGVAASEAARQLDPAYLLTRLGRAPLRDFDDDEEVFQLDWPGGPTTFPPLRTSVRLPADVASFVGRRREVPDVARDLVDHRLVTLTGIGGSGKTRLSVQAARLASTDFPGGVIFVDLSGATSAVSAYESILAALDISAAPGSDALRGQVPANSLLVLDNLEQVGDAAAFVAGVLDATSVTVLATSRSPIGVPGEVVRPVAPLSDADAVALLRARASDAAPGLVLGESQARRIVDLLDGVPLAIELAAARLRVLDPDSLADALESTLSLLVDSVSGRPARHHAVDALLDDAWRQLPDAGRRVLAALSVARGPVAAGGAIDVARLDAVTVLDALQDLVARGLVTSSRRAEGAPAFTVLELVRRLALDRTAPDTLAELRTAFTTAVLDGVLRQPQAAVQLSRDDVRAAMTAAAAGDPATLGLSSTARVTLGRVALAQGWWTETIGLLEPVRPAGDALNALGVALLRRAGDGDVARGRRLLTTAARAGDVDAACALGGSYRLSDPRKANDWYLTALELDDTDPYALGNVLEFEVRAAQSLAPVEPRRDQLASAVHRREQQAAAGEDLPWPWFDLAKFELLLGHDLAALHHLLDAVASSSHGRQLESTLASVLALTLPTSTSAWGDAAEVLRVGARVRFPTSASLPAADAIAPPVVVLVGASARASHDEVMAWLPPLASALEGTEGTLMSGGTAQGVSALAAAVGAELPSWRSSGFAPRVLPDGVEIDARYDDMHRTTGEGFSLLEPLACWDAVARSGIDPGDVHVLGIGGGELTHLELHLAVALGARVAVAGSVTGAPRSGRAFDGWADLPRVAPTADDLRRWLVG